MAHGSTQDAAQDIAPPLIARKDVISDEERDGPRVIGDDLVAEALLLEVVRVVAEQLPHPGMDRREQVGVVVGRDLLEDAREPLETHAGVHAGCRQRDQRAIGLEVELHEHEVPDLEPARALLAVVRDAVRAFRQVGAAIEMDLAARAARADVGHAPPVLLVAAREIAPAHEPLRRQADLVAPDVEGEVVGRVGRGRQPFAGDAQVARSGSPTRSGSPRA